MMKALTLCVLSVLPLGGCADGAAREGGAPLPSHALDVGGESPAEGIEGVLKQVEDNCVVAVSANGDVPLVWPRGYSLTVDNREIVDENAETVAAIGDSVLLGGGTYGSDEKLLRVEDASGTCASADAFIVFTVQELG